MSRIIKPSQPNLKIIIEVDTAGQVQIRTQQFKKTMIGAAYETVQNIHPITLASIFTKAASGFVDMTMQAFMQGNKPQTENPEGGVIDTEKTNSQKPS